MTHGAYPSLVDLQAAFSYEPETGRFDTEQEAREAYLAAKRKYHAPNVLAGTITTLPERDETR